MFEKEYYQLSTTAEIQCGLPANWIPQLVATPQKQRSRSWDTLAAIVFGQAHKNFNAITHAHRLYGQALAELPSELSYPTGSTLMYMTALYKYEVRYKLVIVLFKEIDRTVAGFYDRERLDVTCRRSWMAFRTERPMVTQILC